MFPKILYLIGSAFCAQTPSHSFFYQGQKLPLDARETGIYLGFLTVFIFWLFLKIRKKPNKVFSLSLLAPIIFSILYLAFDGFSSMFRMAWVSNWTRLISGLLFGQSLAILILLILSHSFWANEKTKTKIILWREYLTLAIINLAIFSLFLFEIKQVLYFTGFLIIFGLVLTIFLVNFAFLTTIFFKKLKATRVKIILGLTSAILTFFEFSFLIWLRNYFGV
jgi:uncharacterized membrane protein